jgi:hypothetical protein
MMEMLVNLYADRRLAVAREYVSNAVDTTRAAGSTEPVLVTTTTLIEPNLVVTDRGTGMSVAEVEATFLAFAASSKRESNEMVGGLGVGAKSAWTLAESFLVDTVKGGRRTTVRAARNLEHQVLLAGEPSDLPDGTTIIVPVEVAGHVEAWHRAVGEVAGAHDEGAVLVDGAPVDSLGGGRTWIGPVCCRRVERGDRSAVLVRSGGTLFSSVPEVTRRVLDGTGGLSACVIELPIGSFDHTPSRESVIATERTLAAVDAALGQYRVAYDALAQRVSELAGTDVAAAVALRAETLGGVGAAAMLPIPFRVGVPAGAGAWVMRNQTGRSRWERVEDVRDDMFEAVTARAELSATLVVAGVPAGRVLSRFATFLADEHPTVRRLIAVPEGGTTVALDVFRRGNRLAEQTWEIATATGEIAQHYTFEQWSAAIAARRTTRGSVPGYDCHVCDRDGAGSRVAMLSGPEIVALGLPVVYTDDARPYRTPSGQPASVTVYLGKRKSGPLLAAVPGAMTRGAWLARRFAAETAGWSQTELLAAAYTHSQCATYKAAFDIAVAALAGSADEHPHRGLFARIAALVHAAEKVTEAKTKTLQALSGCAAARTRFELIRKLHNELRQAYPLLAHLRHWDNETTRAHYVAYVAHTPPQVARTAA